MKAGWGVVIGFSSLRHGNDLLGEHLRAGGGTNGHFHKKRRSPESRTAGLVHGPRLIAVNLVCG